jgi:hypothetical protein
MLGNYRAAVQLVASRVVLSSTELVSGDEFRTEAVHMRSSGNKGVLVRNATTQGVTERFGQTLSTSSTCQNKKTRRY